MEHLVTIEIFGQPYSFKSEADGLQAKEAARFLAKEVQRVEQQHRDTTPDANKIAILISVALKIAHELHELKSTHDDLLTRITERTDALCRTLERHPPSAP